jgi:hypothetical protein
MSFSSRILTFLALSTVLLLGMIGRVPAYAQDQIVMTKAEYTFGGEMILEATAQTASPVQDARLFLKVEGESSERENQVVVDPAGKLSSRVDLTHAPIRAFSPITYWFEVNTQSGEKIASPQTSLFYEDNRFKWKTMELQPFQVHWYEGDNLYAQQIADVAQAGLQRVQGLLPLKSPSHIDIYAYRTAAEMQATLNQSEQNWVAAGHADPDLGVMVVTLPPGPESNLLMEQRIPHELMHILLYQDLGAAYTNLPTWLNEGLASSAELYPNPEYLTLLDGAYQKGSLLPIESLCKTFPRDASSALLAYAEAASFTRYLHEQYGNTGLEKLVNQYRENITCENGIQLALGNTLFQQESQWRRDIFGENTIFTALRNLIPWTVLLLVVIFVPLGLTFFGLRRKSAQQNRK